ncbi:MAG TPA: DUF2232 domain-containing protein [Xanthobacteraceae bacterium]|jgi:hypothetical protein|nr:DUF2232 domain-containing protein [Xanthobacteraceae bacterium]
MVQIILIGIAAGFAAALLFASVVSGSFLSILLFYLAPLPVMIAALGWSHLSGLIAAVVAALGLAVAFGGFLFAAFLVGVGLPAWWLSYLAMLSRPVDPASPDHREWYPIGRLVVWCAILGMLVVAMAIPNFGFDADSFRTGLKQAFERIVRIETSRADGNFPIDLDFLVLVIPPMAATLSTITNSGNLWLAARVVNVSGLLRRPWPDISAMKFPTYAPAILAAALALTFAPLFGSLIGKSFSGPANYAPSLINIMAGVLAASMLMAYALLGFAVIHALTRWMSNRTLILTGLYIGFLLTGVAFPGWPMLLMALVGLLDTVLDLRGRMARHHGPPATGT